jgi:hypothetical protein
MNPEAVLQYLISQGHITLEKFDELVKERKEEIASNPESPQAKITTLSEKTNGMQVIDNFTLGKTSSLEEKASGLQAVDNFALQRINELEAKITELETKLGGNA